MKYVWGTLLVAMASGVMVWIAFGYAMVTITHQTDIMVSVIGEDT